MFIFKRNSPSRARLLLMSPGYRSPPSRAHPKAGRMEDERQSWAGPCPCHSTCGSSQGKAAHTRAPTRSAAVPAPCMPLPHQHLPLSQAPLLPVWPQLAPRETLDVHGGEQKATACPKGDGTKCKHQGDRLCCPWRAVTRFSRCFPELDSSLKAIACVRS